MSQSLVQQGGLGIDFSSPEFRLKPGTININQPNTQVEGAIRGKLRIAETGAQFDEMLVTFLAWPTQSRSYYSGQSGTLNRKSENLLCFSRDMVRPDFNAREPQAPLCANCVHQDWTKWRDTHAKEDIPACDAYYYALFIDTVYKMPLQMYIRSKNKKPFEDGRDNLKRTLFMMKSQGINPNVFDVCFKLSTKKIMTNQLPSYVLNMSDFKAISAEQREEFGTIYRQYADNQQQLQDASDVEDDTMHAAAQRVESDLDLTGFIDTVTL